MRQIAVTTVDNPYSPFYEFMEWCNYDIQMGYNTCERLSMLDTPSDLLTEEENNYFIEIAIETLIKTGAIGKDGRIVAYKKVTK